MLRYSGKRHQPKLGQGESSCVPEHVYTPTLPLGLALCTLGPEKHNQLAWALESQVMSLGCCHAHSGQRRIPEVVPGLKAGPEKLCGWLRNLSAELPSKITAVLRTAHI